MRRSLVARRAIAMGETISEAMLTCRRPATGLSPLVIDELAGRTATTAIPTGAQIAWTMIA
jgi:sialic acid synthase SpsE